MRIDLDDGGLRDVPQGVALQCVHYDYCELDRMWVDVVSFVGPR